MTRHPREEAETLLKLLVRTTGKVENFIEEWESLQALKGPEFGGLSLGRASGRHAEREAAESNLPGLTPTAKSSSAHSKRKAGASPEEVKPEESRRSRRASRSKGQASPRRRSKSKEDREEKKKRPRTPPRKEEVVVEKSPKRKQPTTEGTEEPLSAAAQTKETEEEADFGDSSEESPVIDDRKSPADRHHDVPHSPERGEDRRPRLPSRSPPGFRREHGEEADEREPLQRKDKPKKDKGYNHYVRGKEFRDRYGYNRGRGRGGYNASYSW